MADNAITNSSNNMEEASMINPNLEPTKHLKGKKRTHDEHSSMILEKIRDIEQEADFYLYTLALNLVVDHRCTNKEYRKMQELKKRFGLEFAWKVDGIFSDFRASGSVMALYKQKHQKNLPFDFYATVLGKGFLPRYTAVTINMPGEVILAQQHFAEFYKAINYDRQLKVNENFKSTFSI